MWRMSDFNAIFDVFCKEFCFFNPGKFIFWWGNFDQLICFEWHVPHKDIYEQLKLRFLGIT